MKILQTAVVLVPVAMMVGLQGCGGAGGNPGPSADKCVIKHRAVKPELDCEAVSEECCAVLNKDAKMGRRVKPMASVGKCGRNDQVGLFNCIKPPGLKLCTTAPAVGEGTDGDGTCKLTSKLKGKFSVQGVSTGCCTAINNAVAVSEIPNGHEGPSLKAQQKDLDAVCGLIGACGRKDQEGMEKARHKWHPWRRGAPIASNSSTRTSNATIGELLAYMPPTDSMSGHEMMALLQYLHPIEEFPETEALEEEQSVPECQSGGMVAIGFVVGAAFTGLGLVALNCRKQTPLEEPLTA